jgi:hypothetical protein
VASPVDVDALLADHDRVRETPTLGRPVSNVGVELL